MIQTFWKKNHEDNKISHVYIDKMNNFDRKYLKYFIKIFIKMEE
jgi:hypothetical protein